MGFLQGRVSTEEVFALSNSDLVPGKYEGSYSSTLISSGLPIPLHISCEVSSVYV